MPKYLDTRGKTKLTIAVCDRCAKKHAWVDLMPDRNYPGLRVCMKCNDQYDPYRLPARRTENITLPWVRPDVPLGVDPAGVIGESGDIFFITENDEEYWA